MMNYSSWDTNADGALWYTGGWMGMPYSGSFQTLYQDDIRGVVAAAVDKMKQDSMFGGCVVWGAKHLCPVHLHMVFEIRALNYSDLLLAEAYVKEELFYAYGDYRAYSSTDGT